MDSSGTGFTQEERAAMKERAAEADERDALAKIAEMAPEDRVIAEALHAIVQANAPDLAARTWYGMPAYARDGKVIVFFKPAAKFKVRYAEVGFNEWANLDDGDMWPTAFAVTTMNAEIEQALTDLIVKAVS